MHLTWVFRTRPHDPTKCIKRKISKRFNLGPPTLPLQHNGLVESAWKATKALHLQIVAFAASTAPMAAEATPTSSLRGTPIASGNVCKRPASPGLSEQPWDRF